MTEYIDTPFLDLSERVPEDDPGVSLAEGLREFADALEGKSGVGADPEIRQLKAELRRVAKRLMELDPEDQEGPEHRRLRKRYRELQKRLRELGDLDRLPQGAREDSSEDDRLFADFAEQSGLANWLQSKGLDGEPRRTVDLTEEGAEPAQREGRPLFTADDLRRVAEEDDGELPESVRLDSELHEALRAQAHEDAFGPDSGDDLSDAEMWSEFTKRLDWEEGA